MVIGYLFVANASEKTGDRGAHLDADLDGTHWTLLQINSQNVVGNNKATLVFAGDQVGGDATCNRFLGSYETDGDQLSFGLLGTTMRACINMDREAEYLAALALVATYRAENGQLVLSSSDQDAVLVFEPTQHTPLKVTTWQLDRLNNETALVSVLADTQITATFSDDRVAGSAGCNNYLASLTADGEKLSIGPAGSTKMFCAQPEGIMEQELAYLKALSSVQTCQIEENTLALFGADGERLCEFVAVESN